MKVSLRVLAAVNEKRSPDTADVETLRQYLSEDGPFDLDELACEVIQKALGARAKARSQINHAGGVS
ncbi:MAG TPA: hypothetical protein VKT49_19970 [Bryobacteraceae bacterium]|nr:hypothetical protein [Bryobacteraceae bacterium]